MKAAVATFLPSAMTSLRFEGVMVVGSKTNLATQVWTLQTLIDETL